MSKSTFHYIPQKVENNIWNEIYGAKRIYSKDFNKTSNYSCKFHIKMAPKLQRKKIETKPNEKELQRTHRRYSWFAENGKSGKILLFSANIS